MGRRSCSFYIYIYGCGLPFDFYHNDGPFNMARGPRTAGEERESRDGGGGGGGREVWMIAPHTPSQSSGTTSENSGVEGGS